MCDPKDQLFRVSALLVQAPMCMSMSSQDLPLLVVCVSMLAGSVCACMRVCVPAGNVCVSVCVCVQTLESSSAGNNQHVYVCELGGPHLKVWLAHISLHIPAQAKGD